jgi:hypothetical protein
LGENVNHVFWKTVGNVLSMEVEMARAEVRWSSVTNRAEVLVYRVEGYNPVRCHLVGSAVADSVHDAMRVAESKLLALSRLHVLTE